MKKKVMSVVLAAAMAVSMVVPAVSASAADKLVVYGIYKAGDQTWFIDEGDAAKKAVEDAGGEFIYVDAKMSPEEYLKAIDNAVANNASGIITCTPDQTLSQAAVDKAKDADIPIVACDDALQDDAGEKLAPWVGINAYAIGQTNGEWMFLAGLVVFVGMVGYFGMWQIRYIKLVQRIYPDKKGDPTSINFQEQWLASCDEAEKEEIYEASYKTYLLTGKVLPFCTLVAMLLHMVWNTGVLAIIIPAFLWILSASNYCRCCVTKKSEKLAK